MTGKIRLQMQLLHTPTPSRGQATATATPPFRSFYAPVREDGEAVAAIRAADGGNKLYYSTYRVTVISFHLRTRVLTYLMSRDPFNAVLPRKRKVALG